MPNSAVSRKRKANELKREAKKMKPIDWFVKSPVYIDEPHNHIHETGIETDIHDEGANQVENKAESGVVPSCSKIHETPNHNEEADKLCDNSNIVRNFNDLGTYLDVLSKIDDNTKYSLLKEAFNPPGTYVFPAHLERDKFLRFQHNWLSTYEWLVYSQKLDGGLCKYCACFGDSNLGLLAKKPMKLFNKTVTILKEHDGKSSHKTAMEKATTFLQVMDGEKENVKNTLEKQRIERITRNRDMLRSITKTIIFCGHQGLPLRGHRDSSEALSDNTSNHGNFWALLKFRVDSGDLNLAEHFGANSRNALYTSNTIQNELITIVCSEIRSTILKRIGQNVFSILADEVTDCSNKEQLSLVVRYVDSDSNINEHLLEFCECASGTSGLSISSLIIRKLQEYGLNLNKLRGLGFDGAGNMSGSVKGAAARIQQEYPKALYFHCAAHCLNLCVVKSAEIKCIRNLFGTMQRIHIFFHAHPKRQSALLEAVAKVIPEARRKKLSDVCRTRWIERIEAITTMVELYPAIMHCFKSITSDGSSCWSTDSVTDAQSYLLSISNPEFVVALKVTQHALGYIHGLTTSLQAVSIDLVQASSNVQHVLRVLKSVRIDIDDFHSQWYKEAESMATQAGFRLKSPRQCSRQVHRENTPADTTVEYFRRVVTVPFLNHLISEMESRFSNLQQKAFSGQAFIPSVLVKMEESAALSQMMNMAELYEDDIPYPGSLASELHSWQYRWLNETIGGIPTTAIDSLSYAKNLFPNVYALLRTFCVLPITTCTAERSFSALKTVKTAYRSQMLNSRLSGLTLMYFHRNIDIDIESVINTFARKHPRRMTFINLFSDQET